MKSAGQVHEMQAWAGLLDEASQEMLAELSDHQMHGFLAGVKNEAAKGPEHAERVLGKAARGIAEAQPLLVMQALVAMYAREYVRRLNAQSENEV